MGKPHTNRFITLVKDAKTRISEISPAEMKEKIDAADDVILIDVREQDEWQKSHIAG